MPAIPHSADEEIRCVGCAYELSRLARSGKCPECGIPIEMSNRGDALAGRLPAYIAKLRRGALLVIISINILGIAVLAIIFEILIFFSPPVGGEFMAAVFPAVAAFAFLVFFLLYSFGWWKLGAPDPDMRERPASNFPQRFVRWSTLLMIGGAIAYVAYMLIVPSQVASGRIVPNSSTEAILKALGRIVEWSNPILWALQTFAAARYLRWLAERIPNAKAYKRASLLMWMGPLLMLCTFLVIPTLIAIALLYRLVSWVHEDLKKITEPAVASEIAEQKS